MAGSWIRLRWNLIPVTETAGGGRLLLDQNGEQGRKCFCTKLLRARVYLAILKAVSVERKNGK